MYGYYSNTINRILYLFRTLTTQMSEHITNTQYKSEKDPEFYDHNESYDIMEVVLNIQKDRVNLSIDELGSKYSSFKKDFQPLFVKVCKERLSRDDLQQLKYMLEMRKRVQTQELSFKDASSEVCVTSAQKYQPELLKSPDQEPNPKTKKD